MYQSHWGLRESPFHGDLVMQFLHQSPTHGEALARLQFLVQNHRRLGLLMGPSGSGKSLVLETFAEQLRRRGRIAVKLNLLGVEPAEMLFLLAAGLKLNPDPSTSTTALWRAITDRLTEFYYQKLETVILLDDADCADNQVLAQVTRLAKHDRASDARLTFVLAGRREKFAVGRPIARIGRIANRFGALGSGRYGEFFKNIADQGRKQIAGVFRFGHRSIARTYTRHSSSRRATCRFIALGRGRSESSTNRRRCGGIGVSRFRLPL